MTGLLDRMGCFWAVIGLVMWIESRYSFQCLVTDVTLVGVLGELGTLDSQALTTTAVDGFRLPILLGTTIDHV